MELFYFYLAGAAVPVVVYVADPDSAEYMQQGVRVALVGAAKVASLPVILTWEAFQMLISLLARVSGEGIKDGSSSADIPVAAVPPGVSEDRSIPGGQGGDQVSPRESVPRASGLVHEDATTMSCLLDPATSSTFIAAGATSTKIGTSAKSAANPKQQEPDVTDAVSHSVTFKPSRSALAVSNLKIDVRHDISACTPSTLQEGFGSLQFDVALATPEASVRDGDPSLSRDHPSSPLDTLPRVEFGPMEVAVVLLSLLALIIWVRKLAGWITLRRSGGISRLSSAAVAKIPAGAIEGVTGVPEAHGSASGDTRRGHSKSPTRRPADLTLRLDSDDRDSTDCAEFNPHAAIDDEDSATEDAGANLDGHDSQPQPATPVRPDSPPSIEAASSSSFSSVATAPPQAMTTPANTNSTPAERVFSVSAADAGPSTRSPARRGPAQAPHLGTIPEGDESDEGGVGVGGGVRTNANLNPAAVPAGAYQRSLGGVVPKPSFWELCIRNTRR